MRVKWLAWTAVITTALALGACASASSDTGAPSGVKVQQYRDSGTGRTCLVFTHDTAQGASIAVDCVPSGRLSSASEDHQ